MACFPLHIVLYGFRNMQSYSWYWVVFCVRKLLFEIAISFSGSLFVYIYSILSQRVVLYSFGCIFFRLVVSCTSPLQHCSAPYAHSVLISVCIVCYSCLRPVGVGSSLLLYPGVLLLHAALYWIYIIDCCCLFTFCTFPFFISALYLMSPCAFAPMCIGMPAYVIILVSILPFLSI